MNDVLEDRLTDLFDRAGAAVVVDGRSAQVDAARALEPVDPPHRRPWMLVAAAAVVVVGAAGVVRVVDDRSQQRSVAQSADFEPLYVLPSDLPGWTSGNGSTSAGSMRSHQSIVFGILADGLFLDPAVVTLTADPPERFSTDTWREVSYNGEMVFLSPEDQRTRNTVTQHLDAGWLTSSSNDPAAPNVAAIDAVAVDATGTLRLDAPGLEVIASYDIPSALTAESTYSEAYGPDDEYVVVETVSGNVPLLAVADWVYELEPISVNGKPAWRASGFDVDGERHAIDWEFAPGQSVTVSNHSSFEELLTVAESLEVVDEATWTAATS